MNNYNTEKLKLDYKERYLDIGTGDGRFVVKSALKHPSRFYLGIDPAKNIEQYQREINRKKIKNAILLQTSFENFKIEPFTDFFSGITVILPWGNLLKYVSECNAEFFSKLSSILKESSECLIVFGYEEELESSQTQRLQLPELNEEYIEKLKNLYENLPEFVLIKFNKISNNEINKVDSSWAKKLTFGRNRPYFKILLKKSY